MSEQFYTSLLTTSPAKKRRQGQRMTKEQRVRAQALFLVAYEQTANIVASAAQAEIDRHLVYYWQEHDEAFGLAFHLADAAANARIEAEIRRRGMEGIAEPVVSQGQIVYEQVPVLDSDGRQQVSSAGTPRYRRGAMLTMRKYSDTLLIFYAKRRMPEYRDKQQVDMSLAHTGEVAALHDALAAALADFPEAREAVAQALFLKEQAHGRL